MTAHTPEDLQRIYEARFGTSLEYRTEVWDILIRDFFQKFVSPADAVLDLGCGYGEFIRQIQCSRKYAMDANVDAPKYVGQTVKCFIQDCSQIWPLKDNELDVVFTSNFFEHLPDKQALGRTLDEVKRCLKPGGKLIAMGPNIRFLPGSYWDFWDHYLPLNDRSLTEALQNRGYRIESCIPRFLPYTMAQGPKYPLILLRTYLRLRLAWKVFGKQFLVVANKP